MEGFPRTPRLHAKFPYVFCFDLNDFLMKKLFNIQYLLHCRSKHYETNLVHPYSLKAFQQYNEHGNKHYGLGDFNMTNKTNKQVQPSSKDRCLLVKHLKFCH
jgi:hypothetical protein